MSKGTRWPLKAFQDKKLIEVDGIFVKASSQVAKRRVEKLPSLLERAIQPDNIDGLSSLTNTERNKLSGIAAQINKENWQRGEREKLDIGNKPAENKKVHNAVKSTNAEGVKFDSNLEKHMYGLLKASRIYFNFQVPYVLQEKFAYGTENIRAITLTVDFFLPVENMIIDTKGMQTQQGAMRYKMLKKHLFDTQPNNLPVIELPATKDECDLLLNRLLYQS